jgi:hypothetical protein
MHFMRSREAESKANDLIGDWVEMAVSYCMPAIVNGRPRFVAFRFCLHPDPVRGSYIDAPVQVALLDPITGEATDDDEAKLRLARIEHLPAVGWTRFPMPRSEWNAKDRELRNAVDAVMPAFASGQTDPSPEVRGAARLVDRRLEELYPGMRPYYAGASPEFFAWLKLVAVAK